MKKTFVLSIVLLSVVTQLKSQISFSECEEIPSSVFIQRRNELRKAMPDNGVAIFFANPKRRISGEIYHFYNPNASIEYFTGYKEAHCVLLIYKRPILFDGQERNEILLFRPAKKFLTQWEGPKLSKESIKIVSGIQEVLEGHKLYESKLFPSLITKTYLIERPILIEDVDSKDSEDLFSMVHHLKLKLAQLKIQKNTTELKDWVAELRYRKDKRELCLMKETIAKTIDCISKSIEIIDTGVLESDVLATFNYWKTKHQTKEAFPTMIAAGGNTCIVNYRGFSDSLKNGELLLIDGGLENKGYASDVCRTFPINGTFSKEQAAIYRIVLKAQQAAIDECVSGGKYWKPHQIATNVISDELIKLKIISKPQEVRSYFMHGTVHYIGKEVHDVGTYNTLKEGNVLSVEPGIYIPKGSSCDKKWWGIGIRLEDMVLITRDDPEVLTIGLPKSIDEIERIMNKNK